MAEETRFTAQTALSTINTANSNLNGTGTIVQIIQAEGVDGSTIKSINIKAISTTTRGMIRLYTDVAVLSDYKLFAEIEVPALTPSSIDASFEWYQELDMDVSNACIIAASTQKAEAFHIIVEALGRSYYEYSVRRDTTQFTANTGMVNISTANPNRDGSGTVATVLTAGAAASGWFGCRINRITIKAKQTTSQGMVRLYIEVAGTKKLFREIPVPSDVYSSSEQTFEYEMFFESGYNIEPDAKLLASTEKGEIFMVIAEAQDWKYLE